MKIETRNDLDRLNIKLTYANTFEEIIEILMQIEEIEQQEGLHPTLKEHMFSNLKEIHKQSTLNGKPLNMQNGNNEDIFEK